MWRHVNYRFGETHCPLHWRRVSSYFEILVQLFKITHQHIPQNCVSVLLLLTHEFDDGSFSLKCVNIYRVTNARRPTLLLILP
jgi:hypothetical protein